MSGSTCGLYSSENAGMSSANYVGIIMAENLRFLGEGSSAQGKPGAKARPRGVDRTSVGKSAMLCGEKSCVY